ncbi:MAG: AIM24 family protein, partial [Gorillibacterium sp.]|nr:AIM24 family protein [Gorillibacterium sp.]
GGYVIERELAHGDLLRIDTGCLVAMSQTIDYNIEMVKGVKTALFGGEGLFYATLRGPGKVWIQSLPFSRMADRIITASRPGGKREEGSILGGLGNLLDGR